LLLSACVAAGAAAQASDSLSVARRVVAATSLAAKEYAVGVPPGGRRVFAPAEVEEAKQFLDGARADVGGLPSAVRATADSGLVALRALIERVAPPDSVAERAATLVQRIAAAAGGGGRLTPSRCAPPRWPVGRRSTRSSAGSVMARRGGAMGPRRGTWRARRPRVSPTARR